MICAPAGHTPSSMSQPSRVLVVFVSPVATGRQAGTGANQIKAVEYRGAVISDEKAKLFANCYYMLLGTEIQLDSKPWTQTCSLPPFTLAEAKTAIAGMNKNSARGLMASARHSTVLRGITSHPGLSTSWHSMTTMST